LCWNAEVSIQTFLFATICCILGYNYGFPIEKLIFFIVFSMIQLVEYFLWKNLNDKKKNEFYSKMGFLVILLEPLAAINMIQNIQIKNYSIFIYLIVTFIYLYFNYKNIDFTTTIGKKGYLHWNWLEKFNINNKYTYYYILWTFFIIFGSLLSKDFIIFIIGLLTYLFSWYNLSTDNSFSSYWCSIANILWFYVIFWIIYKNYKK
jgi:hypothetical protein